jgi:hypothetical protein
MPARISVPNVHVLYDPPFARAQVAEHFEPWLAVGREVLTYGADLLLRALGSAGESVPDLVIIGGLFRQALMASDGCLLSLEGGGVQQAFLHARGLTEASLSVQWVLHQDRNRWARQYYVSTIRQNRMWQLRALPGTPEASKSEAVWKQYGASPSEAVFDLDEVKRAVKESDDLLRHPEYRDINGWFEQYGLKGKPPKQRFQEPNWYQPGSGGATSIGDMARKLGRGAEYDSMYKYFSYFAHGSLADNHFKVRDGRVTIEPMRYLKQFSQAFNLTFVDLAQVCRWITATYRPEELNDYVQRYRREWSPRLMDFVNVNIDPITISFD